MKTPASAAAWLVGDWLDPASCGDGLASAASDPAGELGETTGLGALGGNGSATEAADSTDGPATGSDVGDSPLDSMELGAASDRRLRACGVCLRERPAGGGADVVATDGSPGRDRTVPGAASDCCACDTGPLGARSAAWGGGRAPGTGGSACGSGGRGGGVEPEAGGGALDATGTGTIGVVGGSMSNGLGGACDRRVEASEPRRPAWGAATSSGKCWSE